MTAARSDEAPSRSWASRRLYVTGAVLALVVLVLAAPYVLVANPETCGGCHEMRPYVESWKASTHAVAADDCADCHAAAGPIGGFAYRMALYGEFIATIGGTSFEPGHAAPPDLASCLRGGCHSANRVSSPSGDLKIGHRVHIEDAGLPCVRCHPGAGHKGVDGRSLTPPMKTCKECHQKEMEYCAFCHVRSMGPQDLTAAPLEH